MPAVTTSDALLLTTRRGDVILVGSDGRKRGSVSVGSAVDGPAALVDGRTLVVGVDGGRYGLVALDLLAGRTRWRALRGIEVDAGVVVAGGVAVAPALDGVVYGIDLSSGEVRWQAPGAPHSTYRAPPIAVADDRVIVANSLGRIAAYDADTGTTVWTVEVGAPVEEAPAAAGEWLVIPTTRGTLVALDAASGVEGWRFTSGDDRERYYTPAVAEGTVYVGSSGGALVARRLSDGGEQWRYESDGHVASAPLIVGAHVFAGTLDERLVVLDAASGAPRGSYELTGRAKSTPSALGGLVIVPAEPGLVWAFRAATGATLP
jgi:outer membrane protein assembly factor BamB